jgi:hypothetical protein
MLESTDKYRVLLDYNLTELKAMYSIVKLKKGGLFAIENFVQSLVYLLIGMKFDG